MGKVVVETVKVCAEPEIVAAKLGKVADQLEKDGIKPVRIDAQRKKSVPSHGQFEPGKAVAGEPGRIAAEPKKALG